VGFLIIKIFPLTVIKVILFVGNGFGSEHDIHHHGPDGPGVVERRIEEGVFATANEYFGY